MPRIKDIIGQVFGRLTVISLWNERTKCGHTKWLCKCRCGNKATVAKSALRSGDTRSCGCIRKESPNHRTHGMRGAREYYIWNNMRSRCLNKSCHNYENYGGRGISVCSRWLGSFENFFEDMGSCPEGLTLDRIHNDGDYELSNCRWVDAFTQNSNKRNNKFITHKGKRLTYSQWSRALGGSHSLIGDRIRKGWTEEKAVTTPVRHR